MEFLRRLRIIWTALCLAAAALVGVAYMGNPAGVPILWFFAAVCAALAAHMPTTQGKLALMWFGGIGLFAYGAAWPYGPQTTVPTLTVIIGGYVAVRVIMWLVAGLSKPKNASTT